jgi:protein-L-isoaspartate(D-aspartate) O-methyltransferase
MLFSALNIPIPLMRYFEDTDHHRKLRRKLVNLLEEKGINDWRVLEAIASIPRHYFMPAELVEKAYEDRPHPIGEEQTISQPYTVAYQTQLLDVRTTDRVLEIGTGSAYQAAILASIAYEVFSIERQKKLFERNKHFRYLREFDNLYLFYGDGFEGLPEFAPFDKILITAAAPYVPEKLVTQLKWNGKMVLPLGAEKPQQMMLITKLENDELLEQSFHLFSFVPMLKGKKSEGNRSLAKFKE